MNGNIFEVIVVGAGPSGLMCSYYLKHLGLEHILFDGGRLGESWRSQRWNNFRAITPFKANLLPGAKLKSRNPDAYGMAPEIVAMFQEYVSAFALPVTEQAQVLAVEKSATSPVFHVKVLHDNEIVRIYDAWQVIIAAGGSRPFVPPIACALPSFIDHIHSSAYRDGQQLKPGGVLIVGGGQSGLEIAHDLQLQGRNVWLSARPHPQLPQLYREKEIFQWLADAGVADEASLTDEARRMPVITYEIDDTLALTRTSLAARGVQMLGELIDIRDGHVTFAAWKKADIDAANERTSSILRVIDNYIKEHHPGLAAGEGHRDLDVVPSASVLDLRKEEITNVIWATGYRNCIPSLEYPVSADQISVQERGLTSIEGLYIVNAGDSANSDYVVGAKDQASFVTNHIYGILR